MDLDKETEINISSDPIAALVNCLKQDDINCRVETIKNLVEFSRALGPERSQKELIPFIKGNFRVLSAKSLWRTKKT